MVMAQVRTLDWLTFSVSTAQRNVPSTSCQLRMCLGMSSSYASTRLGIISNEAFVWLLSMRSIAEPLKGLLLSPARGSRPWRTWS